MFLRFGLAILLAWPALASAQTSVPLPAPVEHVIDTAGTLDEEVRSSLETEFRRIRHTHAIDVHAVVWDDDVPADVDLRQLATRLGESWSREKAWIVVVQATGDSEEIAGAHGGFSHGRESAAEDAALAEGLARGRREWTAPSRLAYSALEAAEELIFLQNRRILEQRLASTERASSRSRRAELWNTGIVRISAACAAILLLGLLAVVFRAGTRPSQPDEHRFPEIPWQRRLGAPWSGGGNIRVNYTHQNHDASQ